MVTLKKLCSLVNKYNKQNKKIVFTNGCFDIIHAGHIKLLKEAKKQGDVLIVGINSDSSIRRIKGKERPIINQKQRAAILSAIKYVDHVVIYNELTPYKLIKKLKPHILVKGSDYKLNEVVGRSLVKKVILVPILKGASTTNIINKIKYG